jgi:hypothetical protein
MDTGTIGQWDNGQFGKGTIGHWDNVRTLGQLDNSKVGPRDPGTLGHWDAGETIGPACLICPRRTKDRASGVYW